MPANDPTDERRPLIAFFRQSPVMSEEDAVLFAQRFRKRWVARNEFFLEEDTVSDEYLFMEQGFMRAYTFDPEGNDVTTAFYGPGQVVFEVSSFFNRIPSKENIQAVTDSSGWVISFAELNQLFHESPAFREFGRSVLVKGFTGLKQRMLSMINERAEERYANLVSTRPDIFRHAQLKHIASFLGVTDTSLSRIRKELIKK